MEFTGFCPLYGKEIAEGLCIDIQMEVKREIQYLIKYEKKSEEEIKSTCDNCPNQIRE